MRPTDFSEVSIPGWCDWVLDHGLPPLPDHIRVGETIPVAYWAGPEFGAVTVIRRHEPDPIRGEDTDVSQDTYCFRRTATGWDQATGDGGTNWPTGPDLSPLDVPSTFAALGGYLTVTEDGWRCTAVDGVVGRDAAWIEVVDSTTTTRRPVAAPIGVIVVCVSCGIDSTIRVLAADDSELGQHVVYDWQ